MKTTPQTPEEMVVAYKQSVDQEEKNRLFDSLMQTQTFKIYSNMPRYAKIRGEREDVFQEVAIEMLRAIDSYDPSKGMAFSSWFWFGIKRASRKYYDTARTIHIPLSAKCAHPVIKPYSFCDFENFRTRIPAKQNIDADDLVLEMGGFDEALEKAVYWDSKEGCTKRSKIRANEKEKKERAERRKYRLTNSPKSVNMINTHKTPEENE
jgi:DNA-directed RNA polymerase specialized sigma subunit